jgi:hypothetical protein
VESILVFKTIEKERNQTNSAWAQSGLRPSTTVLAQRLKWPMQPVPRAPGAVTAPWPHTRWHAGVPMVGSSENHGRRGQQSGHPPGMVMEARAYLGGGSTRRWRRTTTRWSPSSTGGWRPPLVTRKVVLWLGEKEGLRFT